MNQNNIQINQIMGSYGEKKIFTNTKSLKHVFSKPKYI